MSQSNWDLMAIRIGAIAGWVGIIGAQIVQNVSPIGIAIIGVLGGILVWAALALAASESRRRAKTGVERVPQQEPWTMVMWGVMVITVIMTLLAIAGTAIAIVVDDRADYWLLSIGYISAAVCGLGATVMLRRARTEYREYHKKFMN